MEYKYLIDVNDKKNWLYPILLTNPDGSKFEDVHFINPGAGRRQMFRVTDSIFFPSVLGDPAGFYYHEHHAAYETFLWTGGSFDLYVDGKKTTVEPGSLTHFQPYQAHGFIFNSPSRKMGFFHDFGTGETTLDSALLRHYKPNAKSDPNYPDSTVILGDHHKREPPSEYMEVPAEKVANVRHISRPMAEFKLDGLVMKMITARWENGGLNEMWAAEMEKGFYAEWKPYPTEQEMYYATDGEVKFKVYDQEFIAYKECIVRIPKYAEHSLTALTDAVMYDVGGLTRWHAFLLDRQCMKKGDPERANNPEVIENMKNTYGCQIKKIGRV